MWDFFKFAGIIFLLWLFGPMILWLLGLAFAIMFPPA